VTLCAPRVAWNSCGVAGSDGTVEAGGRRWRWVVGAAVQWSEVAWGRPGSFTRSQGIQPWGLGGAGVTEVTGPRRAGGGGGRRWSGGVP
jgi:hypothetical protein